MNLSDDRSHVGEFSGDNGSGTAKRFHWGHFVAISVLAFFACGSTAFQQDQLSPERSQASQQNNRAVESKEPQGTSGVQTPDQGPAAARNGRDKQIVEDSAKLLKLANELKTEADRTTLDTLSVGIIRKADEVGKLARSIRKNVEGVWPSANANGPR